MKSAQARIRKKIIDKNVAGSRVISSGRITLDRFHTGARGIFIRSLVDSPTIMSAIVNFC